MLDEMQAREPRTIPNRIDTTGIDIRRTRKRKSGCLDDAETGSQRIHQLPASGVSMSIEHVDALDSSLLRESGLELQRLGVVVCDDLT